MIKNTIVFDIYSPSSGLHDDIRIGHIIGESERLPSKGDKIRAKMLSSNDILNLAVEDVPSIQNRGPMMTGDNTNVDITQHVRCHILSENM